MTTPVWYDADADRRRLDDRTVAILGYGSQGAAHAANLRDAGVRVLVGARPGGPSWRAAAAAGFAVRDPRAATAEADLVMVLVPDQEQGTLYREAIAPALAPGKSLFFAHGFNVHFGEIVPPAGVDVALVAPKAPGPMVRAEYVAGRGVPALVAVHQDASGGALADALAYAAALGCTRAGVLATSFREEVETDLFGEQAVLCGGTVELVKAGFETLVEAGYSPEMAYFECLHELKLIVDLLHRGGLGLMHRAVSDTAEYGDRSRGPRVIGAPVRTAMRELLGEIQDGTFAREWLAEHRAGAPRMRAWRAEEPAHPIETTGDRLRGMMAWAEPRPAGAA